MLNEHLKLGQIDCKAARNGIGAAGAASLAKSLEHNTSLTQLELASNNIGQKSIQQVC